MSKAESEKLVPVEELEVQEGVNHAVHVAVCKVMGWCPGKSVTSAEYLAAVKKFLGGLVERAVNKC